MRPRLADRPLTFSLLVTLGFIVSLVLIVIVGQPFGNDPRWIEGIGAVGRLAVAALALGLLLRLGWARAAGVERPVARAWWIAVPVFAYVLVVYPPLFTGHYRLHLEPMLLALLVGANGFAAGVAEEIVFRGLVLHALMRAWGDELGGAIRAIAVSSLLFASPHLLNLLAGNDPWFTGAQLAWAFLLGAVFALLVLVGGSVWPVAVVHGLGNAVMHLNRLGETVAPEPITAVLLAVAPIPLVAYAAWLFGRSTEHAAAALTRP